MTRTKRAWRKANAYVQSGQHAKAIYWLSRTQALLDSEPRRPMRVDGIESYILGGLAVVIVAIWFAGG
jgi:ABC-type phosphate transport system permease subunit